MEHEYCPQLHLWIWAPQECDLQGVGQGQWPTIGEGQSEVGDSEQPGDGVKEQSIPPSYMEA